MYRYKLFVVLFFLTSILYSCQKDYSELDVKFYYDQIRDSPAHQCDSILKSIVSSDLSKEDQKWYYLLNLLVQSKKDGACLKDEFIQILEKEEFADLIKEENFSFILSKALGNYCKDWELEVIAPLLEEEDEKWIDGFPFFKVSLGSFWRSKRDFALAKKYYLSALTEFEELGLEKNVMRTNYYLGYSEKVQNNMEEAKPYFQSVLNNRESHKDTFLFVFTSSMYSEILGSTEEYEKAIDIALRSRIFAEESNQKSLLNRAYRSLGKVYYDSGDYQNSLKFREMNASLTKGMGSEIKYANALNHLGITLNEMDQWDAAKIQFTKALRIQRELASSDVFAVAQLEMNIGAIFLEKGNLDSAEYYMEKAKLRNSEIAETLDYNVDLAKLYFLQKRGSAAKVQLQKADLIAEKENKIFKRLYNLESLKAYYLESGNNSDYVKSDLIYDSLYIQWQNKVKAKQVARFQAEYNHERQVRAIEILEYDKTLKDIKLREESAAKRFWGIVALAVILLALVLSRLWYQQKKAKESTEKMMKELHHRVKNNLEMLSGMFSLQAIQAENEEVRLSITDNEARVTAMNLIHSKLYQESEQLLVDLDEYLGEIIDNLQHVYAGGYELQIETLCPKFKINVDKAISVGLLVNELCTNAFKYAKPEGEELKIKIAYFVDGKMLSSLKVKDNGVQFEAEKTAGFGSKLIELLSRQLKAKYQSHWSNGFHQTFQFKKLRGA